MKIQKIFGLGVFSLSLIFGGQLPAWASQCGKSITSCLGGCGKYNPTCEKQCFENARGCGK